MIRWIIFILIFGIIDFYAFQAFKTLFRSKAVNIAYLLISLLVVGNLIYQISVSGRGGLSLKVNFAIGCFLSLYIPKIVIMLLMFGEDILRVPQAAFRYFTEGAHNGSYMPSRRLFVSKLALGLAAVPFASFLYGIFIGRYNFRVLKHRLYFEDLPEAFDGYKITQISDIHIGSFDNKEKVEYALDLVNEQASDLILFTGDLVNNRADELLGWENSFSRLHAKDGMYSVLGNHDYGDYAQWDSEVLKEQNLKDLQNIQKDIGFDLLKNESRFIERNGQRIALVGVENWGKGGFKKAGDLKKASENIDENDFKILMTHDPSHWDEVVLKDNYFYHLTLSGHTHGMQFGIEIPGWIKWSPIKWRYKHWAGIYEEKKQLINVNRGFGVLAFPGRVGIWPEITVIELKKGSKPA
jgi:predicted MPP superfamily phosphohydrolase